MKTVKVASILLVSILGGKLVWATDRDAMVMHLVHLNPFIVQKFAQEAVANGYVARLCCTNPAPRTVSLGT